jgi:hypothetical protein
MAALEYAREASRLEGEMPYSFGPPFVEYPSAQLLGELELAQGNYQQAAATFEQQLQRSRKKRLAMEEMLRAELGVGE